MGIFSGTANGSSPMTTGGSGSPGSGKNRSPFGLSDTTGAQKIAGQTRALASKYGTGNLNSSKSLAKPVAGKSAVGAQ